PTSPSATARLSGKRPRKRLRGPPPRPPRTRRTRRSSTAHDERRHHEARMLIDLVRGDFPAPPGHGRVRPDRVQVEVGDDNDDEDARGDEEDDGDDRTQGRDDSEVIAEPRGRGTGRAVFLLAGTGEGEIEGAGPVLMGGEVAEGEDGIALDVRHEAGGP